MPVGHRQQFLDAVMRLLNPIFIEHSNEIPLTHLAGAYEGIEIALLIAPRAHVGKDHVEHIFARLPSVPDFNGRNTQALSENLLGIGIVPSWNRATNIGEMPLADCPVAKPAFVEDRLVHAGIRYRSHGFRRKPDHCAE